MPKNRVFNDHDAQKYDLSRKVSSFDAQKWCQIVFTLDTLDVGSFLEFDAQKCNL